MFLFRKIADSEQFHTFILFLILLNAAVMGLETSAELNEYYGDWFYLIFVSSQFIFVAEIIIRLLSYAPRFGRFFGSFWNTFDFAIVAVSLIPMVGSFALVARLARILRVARVVSTSDQLRNFIDRMQSSGGLFARAFCVLAVFYYIFAVSGFYIFGERSPQYWGTLGDSLQSLFYLTFLQELWAIVSAGQMQVVSLWAFVLVFYAVLFIMLVNLLAAVIMIHFEPPAPESDGEMPE